MYFLITIQKFNNGTATAKAIFEYSTEAEALSALYSTMASSIATETVSEAICVILNSIGVNMKYERWERNPEPVENL